MVSIEKISRKFIQLEEYLDLLNRIAEKTEADFLEDKILIGSAKYYLQVSIECCLDVANHVIASEKYRAPRDYADTFAVLGESGVIEKVCYNTSNKWQNSGIAWSTCMLR